VNQQRLQHFCNTPEKIQPEAESAVASLSRRSIKCQKPHGLLIMIRVGKCIIGVGLLSIAGFAGAASAADFASLPAASSKQFSWTGCYVGGNLGGVTSSDTTTGVSGNSRNFGSTGFIGGGQVGCDYQFAPAWVVGVEGQANWTRLTNTHSASVVFPALGVTVPSQITVGNNFVGSFTARLGYSFAERWLVFGKGGAARTNEKIDDAFTSPAALGGLAVDPSQTTTRTG
jgi:outer membrane immunogenic protein